MNNLTGPNMILLFTVFGESNAVIYQTWDRTTAINMGRYTYTSNLPSPSIAYIANEQASRDYRQYLEMSMGKSHLMRRR